jgi:hypothetical protein
MSAARPKRYGLPHPMADVSPRGDVIRATTAVRQRIADKGAQMVIVTDAGGVLLMHPTAAATLDVIRSHPNWIAGQFDARASDDDVREAMVHAYDGSLRTLQAVGEIP